MMKRIRKMTGLLALPLLTLAGQAQAGGTFGAPRAPAKSPPPQAPSRIEAAPVGSWIKGVENTISELRIPSDIVAYDFETDGFLTVNAMTGAVYMKVDDGRGLSYDTAKLESLLNGQFVPPTVNPVELAISALANVQVTPVSQYDTLRAQAIANNPDSDVYFASRRFVDWASPETAAAYVAMGILSLGSTVPGSIAESAKQIMLEFQEAFAWLKLAAEDRIVDDAVCLIGQMLPGQGCQLPGGVSLSVNPVTIPVTYNAQFAGATGLSVVAPPFLKQLAPSWTLNHLGFEAVLSGRPSVPQGTVYAFDSLKFSAVGQGQDIFLTALSQIVPANDDVRKILNAIDYAAFAGENLLTNVADGLLSQLGINTTLVANSFRGSPIVDLLPTQAARSLETVLKPFAMGNQSSVGVQLLELDLSTLGLSARFKLHHRHVWNAEGEAEKAGVDWAKQLGHDVAVMARHGGGELHRWWVQSGVVQQYTRWRNSTAGFVPEAGSLIETAVLQPGGNMLVKTKDTAGNMLTQVFNQGGTLVSSVGAGAGATVQRWRGWFGF